MREQQQHVWYRWLQLIDQENKKRCWMTQQTRVEFKVPPYSTEWKTHPVDSVEWDLERLRNCIANCNFSCWVWNVVFKCCGEIKHVPSAALVEGSETWLKQGCAPNTVSDSTERGSSNQTACGHFKEKEKTQGWFRMRNMHNLVWILE